MTKRPRLLLSSLLLDPVIFLQALFDALLAVRVADLGIVPQSQRLEDKLLSSG